MAKILTSGVLKQLRLQFTNGSWMQVIPYTWNSTEGFPDDIMSKRRLILWLTHLVLIISNFLFVVVRCIQTGSDQSAPVWLKIYMQFVIALFFTGILGHVSILFQRKTLCAVTQHLITFLRNYEEDFVVRDPSLRHKWSKINHVSMIFIRMAATGNACLFLANAIVRPTSPECILSIWPEMKNCLIARILQTAAFAEIAYSSRISVIVLLCPLVNFSLSLLVVFLELGAYTGRPNIQEMEKKMRIYRQVEILVLEFNQGMLSIVLLVFGTDCTVVVLLMFGSLAEVNKHSKLMLRRWHEQAHLVGNHSDVRLFRKYLQSLRMQKDQHNSLLELSTKLLEIFVGLIPYLYITAEGVF
ncbi:unnamed protein product [Allacma fusca]|uniref:Uncharacterized protein n=1 Tax=Allacma fusca TaxID=39272 RepID=A0A8J2PDL9_9HEXA|nr:unnamed protein product [Allacma fusca]